MSSIKVIGILLVLLLVIGVPVGIVYLSRRTVTETPNNLQQNTGAYTRPAIEVVSEPSNTRAVVGRNETISVNLATGSKKPTAFDLTFSYNSDVVEVVNIVPGRLWNTSNVLKKEIDNEMGMARLAAGQGFNANETTNSDLIEIEYKVLKAGEAVFNLTNESIFAFVGENEVSPVTTSQIVIQAEN